MSNILSTVDQRTQLVGQNRLELLLFRLNGKQRFGINVFKVREVLQCPPLTTLPKLTKLYVESLISVDRLYPLLILAWQRAGAYRRFN